MSPQEKAQTTRQEAAEVVVQPIMELEGFARCVELQLETWGYDESDAIPRRMFVVAQRAGGQVLGAYDGAALVGFAMAIPGYRNRHSYLHSHMLAVKREYRDRGIGRRLKLAQRDDALARGIELIEWTFDPLEIKNAYLNIERLGAISRHYAPDIYGATTSDLQGGLPSDRLYAEWWLRSRRVTGLLSGEPKLRLRAVETVKVPQEIYAWRQSAEDRGRALAVQAANRTRLQRAFADGLAVTGYARDGEGNGSFELARWDEEFFY